MNNLFMFKDLDSHYVIHFFGIRLKIKHKSNFKYSEATEYGLNTEERNPRLIVSLTSFPARINTVHITINTLLKQTLKPDKIILWLANEQFPNKEGDLPQELLRLKELGLTIGWCEDLRSYKKLVPTLREYPNDIIVTTDDDAYYSENLLSSLYNAYLKDNSKVYTKRSVRLKFENNKLYSLTAGKYGFKTDFNPTYLNQLIGCGGVLYPPNCLHKDILNTEKIKSTIPTHDDVYFWTMAVLNKTKIQVVDGFEANLYFIDEAQGCALMNINKDGQSGISLEKAYELMGNEYPELIEIISKDI